MGGLQFDASQGKSYGDPASKKQGGLGGSHL
jgi:hypothetical protein